MSNGHEAVTTAKAFGLDTPHGHADEHCVALGMSCDVPRGGLTGPLMSRYRIPMPNFTAEEAVGAMGALVSHAVEEQLPEREPPLLHPRVRYPPPKYGAKNVGSQQVVIRSDPTR